MKKKRMLKADLAAFKKLILKKKEDIIEHIREISEETVKKSQKDASGDISSYTYHMADVATDNYDREFSMGRVSEDREFLFELECDNPAVSVTGVRHGNTMLLSAGNYREGKEETTITLPEGKIRQIEDIRDKGEFQASGSRLSFRAPKDNLRLFKIVFEK